MKTSQTTLINFGAGPAALPDEVKADAAAGIRNYQNSGLSILETPHRGSPVFDELLAESKQLVYQLTRLDPNEYEVLWLQGGGRMQFAMVPLNFLPPDGVAGYLDSGHWAHEALTTAELYGKVEQLASSRQVNYTSLPKFNSKNIQANWSYLHITTNNTIYGTQMLQDIECPVPLIADMSSDIFAVDRDYSRYDLFYAVAQKNLGIAGVTLVVLRKSLLEKIVSKNAPILDYKEQVKQQSVLNTPPVFAIYVSVLYLRWMAAKGLQQIIKENQQKAQSLYAEIDRNSLLTGITKKEDRSLMNVVFKASNEALEQQLLDFCTKQGITGINGHRSVGGFRVSLYNAISLEQTKQLVRTLQAFEQKIKDANN